MTALLQAGLALALLLALGYGAWEVRRWGTPAGRESVTARQRGYRSWGLFFLLLALALWLGGTYLPTPHTRRALAHYLAYWTLTSAAVLPLIPLALLDWRENLRRALRERQEERLRLRESVLALTDPGHTPDPGREDPGPDEPGQPRT